MSETFCSNSTEKWRQHEWTYTQCTTLNKVFYSCFEDNTTYVVTEAEGIYLKGLFPPTVFLLHGLHFFFPYSFNANFVQRPVLQYLSSELLLLMLEYDFYYCSLQLPVWCLSVNGNITTQGNLKQTRQGIIIPRETGVPWDNFYNLETIGTGKMCSEFEAQLSASVKMLR